jgi:hypothetical protein
MKLLSVAWREYVGTETLDCHSRAAHLSQKDVCKPAVTYRVYFVSTNDLFHVEI